LTRYNHKNKKEHRIDPKGGYFDTIDPGTGMVREPKVDRLGEIIERINDLFAGEITDEDALHYARWILDKTVADETIKEQMENNSRKQVLIGDFPDAVTAAVAESLGAHESMATQILGDKRTMKNFAELLLDLFEAQRKTA
jgi:type I restriction enzyme R subunit